MQRMHVAERALYALWQGDQQRATRYAAVTAEIAKLEGELQGHDCEAMVKKHIAALNEVSWPAWTQSRPEAEICYGSTTRGR